MGDTGTDLGDTGTRVRVQGILGKDRGKRDGIDVKAKGTQVQGKEYSKCKYTVMR